MPLLAVGLNHHTAPLQLRERAVIGPDDVGGALHRLANQGGVREAAILSTCNRTELYCNIAADAPDPGRWLGQLTDIGSASFDGCLYRHRDESAVRHVLRVATGLDSMVLGEPQILGQMKDAYRHARKAKTLGNSMERLFQHSFAVAKKVRTSTGLGASPVSVAFAAVRLAEQIQGRLEKRCAILVGAGETAELAARHLRARGLSRLYITNRSHNRARLVADRLDAMSFPLERLEQHLPEADILVCSTAACQPLVSKAMLAAALKQRRHQPMCVLDLGMPRDVDPAAHELGDLYLYDLDSLRDVAEDGRRERQRAANEAEALVEVQTAHFMAWLKSLDAVGVIRELRQARREDAHELVQRQIDRLHAGADAEDLLRELGYRLGSRFLHEPSLALRRASSEGRGHLLKAARELFQLGPLDPDDTDDNDAGPDSR